MGFFSRKTTKSSTNNDDPVSNSDRNDNNSGDVISSSLEGYTPPPQKEFGDVTMTSLESFEICALHPPQPIGYTMGPAGDGSDYVDADLVTPENTNAEATINAVESGCPVDGIDKERNGGERIATTANADSEADADEEAGGGLPSQKDKFDGIKGVIQTPKYKDLKYSILFMLHFGIILWWFVDSFIPVSQQWTEKDLF